MEENDVAVGGWRAAAQLNAGAAEEAIEAAVEDAIELGDGDVLGATQGGVVALKEFL